MTLMTTPTLPTYFISHGGGPWPYMKKELGSTYDKLEASLQDIARQIGTTPKAVLVISAHWEADEFAVMANPNPPMVYDYSGFPAHTYHVQYRAPGSPELARRVQSLLEASGLPADLDDRQGFDHGTFAPLVAIYPEANVPVIQLSLQRGYDPTAHLQAGAAIAPLRSDGVLLIGSGLSYHNLRRMGEAGKEPSQQFDRWLNETLTACDPTERERRLINWAQAPSARIAHPQEDHLLPLMVALGAARNEQATCTYHEDDFFGGVTVSSFRFGKTLSLV